MEAIRDHEHGTTHAGPFDGVPHLARLLDLSMMGSLRECALLLLERLLVPQAAEQDPRAQRAAKANGQVRGLMGAHRSREGLPFHV